MKSEKIQTRLGPNGIHIFNRQTGLHVLLNELIPAQNSWSLAPQNISIALTNSCNLSCQHCYAPKNDAQLGIDFLKQLLIDLDAEGCLGIGFGGGEPTLYPYLAEISSFATRETRMAVTMTTHGHRLTNELLKKLEGNMHFVRVSMDGIGSTYEKIRGVSFNKLLKRISSLKESIPFGLNFVVNDLTISQLDDAVGIAENYGADEFLILPELQKGRGKQISTRAQSDLLHWIERYSGKTPLTISNAIPSLVRPFLNAGLMYGASDSIHVDAQGSLKLNSMKSNGIAIENRNIIDVYQELTRNPERY